MATEKWNPLDEMDEAELRHYLSFSNRSESQIDRIVEGYKQDKEFAEWQAEMDRNPGLPECIATGKHLSFQTCQTCDEFYSRPDVIEWFAEYGLLSSEVPE